MGLYDEMLTQNSMYQHSQQQIEELRERIQQLEQLAKGYQAFCGRLVGFAVGGVDGTQEEWIARLADLQDQAKQLLG